MLLAHREVDCEGNILSQSLEDHLHEVGKKAAKMGSSIGLGSFTRLAGYLHDCGKADRLFQDLIYGRRVQNVNHSSAGGRVLNDFIHNDPELAYLQQTKGKFAYFQEVMTYIILSHHGIFDLISYGGTEYIISRRLKYDEDGGYHYNNDVVPFVQKFDFNLQEQAEKSITVLIKEAYKEFEILYNKLIKISDKNLDKKQRKEEKEYYISCLTRLCLSILKDADIYDSANVFHHPKQYIWADHDRKQAWEDASAKVENMYFCYESSHEISEINKKRNEFARLAKDAAYKNGDGIYKLELPTGAGKTKIGLRYALISAIEYNRSRIFYITAYLSVLEQNASEIRSIIDKDDIILEHHSNFMEDMVIDKTHVGEDDSLEYNHTSYLRESWESPIILTTMVQFFNTLFKEMPSSIRRFCKLINSVIIIDEVQSLPLKVLSNFNLMMNFMKEIMNCNIVHCTATQPVLDSEAMNHPIYYGNVDNEHAEIVNMDTRIKLSGCFQRVDFFNLTGNDACKIMSTEDLSNHISEQLLQLDSCLVVLNTKSSVLKLYEYLEKAMVGVEVVYLTTNLCAAHRLDIITTLNNKLKQNRIIASKNKLVCISTQLIEAGVDVDFDVVYRSLAGIDSLIQCAGRCNREGKLILDGEKTHGRLYIIRYSEENLTMLHDIKSSSDASEYAIRSIGYRRESNEKIELEKLQILYYNKYYVSNRNKLDYIDKEKSCTMIEELGRNDQDRSNYYITNPSNKKPMMYQAFKTAAENFKFIEEGTTGVIVQYKNQDLLERLEQAMNDKDYDSVKVLLRKLQRYSVNVYLSKSIEPYIYKHNDFDVWFLLNEYYDKKKGIITTGLVDLFV